MSVPFVHLRVHSEFSLVDGLVRIKPLAKGAGRDEHAGGGDHRPEQHVLAFGEAPAKTGHGCGHQADLWCRPVAGRCTDPEAPLSRICFLAMDAKGYRNLTELESRAAADRMASVTGWSSSSVNGSPPPARA